MTAFTFGLVHAPLTPFVDGRIDFDSYAKLIDFHLRNGAEGLAVPMHSGESVSLTVEERKSLLEFSLKHGGRVPVIAHVSESGTGIAASLAAHARKAGAAALIASVPYYWTPPQPMLIEHFETIALAGELPLFIYNAPGEMAGVGVAPQSILKMLERLPNFVGLIDTSLDWQYMIEAVQLAVGARTDFQFITGTEYMISAAAIGATGLLSSLSNICPRAVHTLYKLCGDENYTAARDGQAELAVLCRLFDETGIPGLKAAARVMGRDCGAPRRPLSKLSDSEASALATELAAVRGIDAEPRGWV